MDRCSQHDETMEEIKAIVKTINDCAKDKASSERTLEHLAEVIGEIKDEVKETRRMIGQFNVNLTERATWGAHDKLRDEMYKMGDDLRKYIIKVFSLGISFAGVLFGIVQWVLSVANGG